MKVTLISHASVIIETSDCVIWTDPWLFGTAFNDSWKLLPAASLHDSWYSSITHIWISHEHPDHFHLPTLKSLPQEFKDKITLLFQYNNSDKMLNAFQKLAGFKNVQTMKNRKFYDVTTETRVYCFQVGQMDSSLAVKCGNETLLNLNDCEASPADKRILKNDLGKIDVLLNQFSMAGYNGNPDYKTQLTRSANAKLNILIEDHIDLGAMITIPFASFIYFCCLDNKYINEYANTPGKCLKRFNDKGLEMIVLSPGDNYVLGETFDNEKSLKKFEQAYKNQPLIFDAGPVVTLDVIQQNFIKRRNQLFEKFPGVWLWFLGVLTIRIPDLQKCVRLSIRSGEFRVIDQTESADLEINSQPLKHCFEFTWGVQTLGVSGRYLIFKNHATWRWYRIVTSLNNAEIYLKFKFLFTRRNFDFIRSRSLGLASQIFYKYQIRKNLY